MSDSAFIIQWLSFNKTFSCISLHPQSLSFICIQYPIKINNNLHKVFSRKVSERSWEKSRGTKCENIVFSYFSIKLKKLCGIFRSATEQFFYSVPIISLHGATKKNIKRNDDGKSPKKKSKFCFDENLNRKARGWIRIIESIKYSSIHEKMRTKQFSYNRCKHSWTDIPEEKKAAKTFSFFFISIPEKSCEKSRRIILWNKFSFFLC